MLDVPSHTTGAQENYSSTFSAESCIFLELCSEPCLIFVLDFVLSAVTSLFSIDPLRKRKVLVSTCECVEPVTWGIGLYWTHISLSSSWKRPLVQLLLSDSQGTPRLQRWYLSCFKAAHKFTTGVWESLMSHKSCIKPETAFFALLWVLN